MMEIFHFIPAVVAIIAFAMGSKSSVRASLIALSASIFGIAFGSIFHAAHTAMIFDPCYIYFAIDALNILAELKKQVL